MHKCTEVDSEGSEKEEEHSRGSQVKQKGSSRSETMTSTSKGITSRHACLVFSYVIYVNTYGPIVPREQSKTALYITTQRFVSCN